MTSRLLQSEIEKQAEWTPGQWTEEENEDSQEEEESREKAESLMSSYNEAIATLSEKTKVGKVSPLTFQLKSTWDEATEAEKEICIEKAMEGCSIVCEIIAPNAGEKLLQSCVQSTNVETEHVSGDLVALMQAYKNAPTKNLKRQILSIYAYRYPMNKLQKLHEPYESITTWQIKKARAHARECGPGLSVEKPSSHRVRLDTTLVDHFVDFINRPYFYQDVAFGTRKLKLDNGEEVTMPNVVRTVTRSTMISQYLMFCEEEMVVPLSRATLFRILEVREASQQRSLCGLDNTAAEGSAGFERICRIVEDLQQMGEEKSWAEEMKKSIQDGKRYFKTEYRNHCQQDDSGCPDHCPMFALSDANDSDLKEQCAHKHSTSCSQCDDISICLGKIGNVIKSRDTKFYSKEQQEDILYDFERATKAISQWKAHIMRSTNQERAKQEILEKLDPNSNLIVMDWAMKFLQIRFREKQSDSYGKRGLSWHVSSVVSRDELTRELKVTSFVHLFDQCTQDWFAVASIIEHLLKYLKVNDVKSVYLRSDEAGCYHSNFLIASVKDIGETVGIAGESYDFSEPQSGKDICDRILCPLKSSIRAYCSEGHDILTASDMREALQQHPVRGTSATVSVVEESKKTLLINKLDHFGSFHNFRFEESGIRAWEAYSIGRGKLFPYDTVLIQHQGPTMLQTEEGFPATIKERELKPRKKPLSDQGEHSVDSNPLFECSVPGCAEAFNSFTDLESHLDVGQHNNKQATSSTSESVNNKQATSSTSEGVNNKQATSSTSESVYDGLRRDWAAKFASVDVAKKTPCVKLPTSSETPARQPLQMGWAISKAHTGSTRFSPKVKEYLTRRFDIGERTGRKADPAQVEKDMRTARNPLNERQFSCTEWLTKTQIQSFFSRLAASRRKEQGSLGMSFEKAEDVECLVEDTERQELLEEIADHVGLKHPVTFDVYDLCEYYHQGKLSAFNVQMLKNILSYLEVPFKSKDKKSILLSKLSVVIGACNCDATLYE